MSKYLVLARYENEPHMTLCESDDALQELLTQNTRDGMDAYEMLTSLKGLSFEEFPEHSAVVFRGEIVVPQPIETVTKWKVS